MKSLEITIPLSVLNLCPLPSLHFISRFVSAAQGENRPLIFKKLFARGSHVTGAFQVSPTLGI